MSETNAVARKYLNSVHSVSLEELRDNHENAIKNFELARIALLVAETSFDAKKSSLDYNNYETNWDRVDALDYLVQYKLANEKVKYL